ncbi:microfibrillar-associated protein 5 isoform X2 [Podarcis muralis]
MTDGGTPSLAIPHPEGIGGADSSRATINSVRSWDSFFPLSLSSFHLHDDTKSYYYFAELDFEGKPKENVCWDWERLGTLAKLGGPAEGRRLCPQCKGTECLNDSEGMMACGAQKLLCLVALIALSTDWFLPVVIAQDDPTDAPDIPGDVDAADPAAGAADVPGDTAPSTAPECREEQFPCTRLYSVHKPVKQCISYLCVTSVRRTYMINKEICSRIVCKEDEAMQEEICRQMAGLPPRRLRRSGRPRGPPCRRAQLQRQNAVDPQ